MRLEMKWRKSDKVKLSNYVRKFNTSVTKFANQYPELADSGLIPDKLDIKALRDSEMTRKDFNNLIHSIDRWFKPGAREVIQKEGIPMTQWQYNEIRYAVQRINYRRKKMREASPRSIRQQGRRETKPLSVADKLKEIKRKLELDDSYGIYGAEEAAQSWETFRKRVIAQSTENYVDKNNALYYYNYNRAIYENFPDDMATAIGNLLEDFRLTGEELWELTGNYPEIDIEYMYSPEEEDGKYEYIMEMLPKAVAKLFPDKYEAAMERRNVDMV